MAQRRDLGRARRSVMPRSALAEFIAPQNRPDPVDLLESQAASRIADLLPVRYGRMLPSRFAFFRGAALLMAADLASAPDTGLTAQLCGDAHVSNFGLFASPERNLVFDVNDFDETLPGPWSGCQGLVARRDQTQKITALSRRRAVVRSCARLLRSDAHARDLCVSSMRGTRGSHDEGDEVGVDHTYARDPARRPKPTHATTLGAVEATRVVDGRRRLASDPPLHSDRRARRRGTGPV